MPKGQVYVPRLEPTVPIRLADRNHAHYSSRHSIILKKKDGSLTDFKHAQFDPHRSHRKMFSRTLGTPNRPLTPWIRCLNQSHWLPFGEQKGVQICTMDLVCQVYVKTSSDDSCVD